MNRGLQLIETHRHLVHGLQGKPVKPRFERQLLRAVVVAKSPGDDFVHNFRGRETVFGIRDLLASAAEVEFAVDETFQPREIRIYIGADVIGGNGGRKIRRQCLLERNAGLGRFLRPSSPASPFVAGAEQFLMPADLLDELVKGSLDGRGWAGSFLLDSQLTGRQAQVQGDERSLARRILLDNGFQMDQFGPEDLKALLDFLDLVADFFFDVGSFLDLVTDVNVHFRASNAGEESREAAVPTTKLYTRRQGVGAKFAAALPFPFRAPISRRRNPLLTPLAC